jgi:PilZ domain
MDRRCGTRMPCDFRVLVMVHPAVFGPGVLLNVSISGALLETPLVLSPLTQIELEVESPGMGRSSIMASITRRERQRYGVAFRGANNTVIDRMLRLAQSNAEAEHVANEVPHQSLIRSLVAEEGSARLSDAPGPS